jgi:hypothetical protein
MACGTRHPDRPEVRCVSEAERHGSHYGRDPHDLLGPHITWTNEDEVAREARQAQAREADLTAMARRARGADRAGPVPLVVEGTGE